MNFTNLAAHTQNDDRYAPHILTVAPYLDTAPPQTYDQLLAPDQGH